MRMYERIITFKTIHFRIKVLTSIISDCFIICTSGILINIAIYIFVSQYI